MANLFTFRVDAVEGVTRESVQSFLSQHTAAHCVVHEISDKTKKSHYQGWVWTDVKVQTWKSRIKAQWPAVKGTRGRNRGKYSGAPVRDYERYQMYCMKGTPTELPDIVSCQLKLDEQIDVDNMHRQFWSKQTSVDPEKKSTHIVSMALEFFKNYAWSDSEDVMERRRKISQYIIQQLKEQQKSTIDTYRIRGWTNAVTLQLFEEFEEILICEVCNRI